MIIENHLLRDIEYIRTTNHAGPFRAPPTLLIMHYTASGRGARNDALFFANPSLTSASAHIVMDRDGSMIQCVPFDKIAHHAGSSSWRGRVGCNNFSIGIEIDNWGPLTRREDGKFYSWRNEEVPSQNVIHARHKNGRGNEQYWEAYPIRQLDVLAILTRAILKAYPSIREIVGHDDVAPQRKLDPGPAFPLGRFQNIIEDRGASPQRKARVLASKLNVRSGPGTNFNTLDWGPLAKGAQVMIRVDGPEWDLIEYRSSLSLESKSGWVASEYLEYVNG